MLKLLLSILLDEQGGTLAITRKTANTLATAAGMNTNYDEIEAVVNGGIDGDNIADDAVSKGKLAADVVRSGYGLIQHTDGALYVDVYGVMANAGTNGVEWGRAGDMLLSSNATTPDGFTDVSATYADKFIRISATALTAAGADTHTHTVTVDSHTLTSAEMPAHTHPNTTYSSDIAWTPNLCGGSTNIVGSKETGSTGGDGAHSHTNSITTGDNVPAYISLRMYSKN
jgi:hypothetical protein